MVVIGLTVFLGGFVIWSLDNHYCSEIRRWRHVVGLPWGIFLEGHGWWSVAPYSVGIKQIEADNRLYRHLMTGAGAYMYIVWGIWLRHCLNGRQDEYVLRWPNKFLSLPDIVRAPQVNAKLMNDNGSVNGMGNGILKDITNNHDGYGCLKKIC